MIGISSHGDTKKTQKFLKFMKSGDVYNTLPRYGRQGVDLLSSATPQDTGLASQSWGSQVGHTNGIYSVSWFNTNREGGLPVVLLIQYGHGTGTGGYVRGRDFINPALRPLFDRAVNEIWRQVTNG